MPRYLRHASLLAALALVGTACAGDDGSPTSPVAAETATTAAARATTTTPAPTQTADEASSSPSTVGDPSRGLELWDDGAGVLDTPCSQCHSVEHSVDGAPSLEGIDDRAGRTVDGLSAEEYLRQSILDPRAYLVPGFEDGPGMPNSYQYLLSDEDVDDLVAFLLSIPAPETAATPATPAATLAEISDNALRDIPYSEDHPKQVVDVYLPTTGEGPFPTILAIHGGGFYANSKGTYSNMGPWYAANGYAFVATNYRLTPTDSYPAQVEDSFCALAWLHDNAPEYGFDSEQVIVTGGSAGGYLAAMVGTADDPSIYLEDCPNEYPSTNALQGVVIYYGMYDFTDIDDFTAGEIHGSLKRFWGAAYEDIPAERIEEMSPIAQIDGSEPPFIILHGTADKSIPSVKSERFATALDLAGVDVELVLLPEVGHAFELKPLTGPEMTLALNAVDEFLDRTLGP